MKLNIVFFNLLLCFFAFSCQKNKDCTNCENVACAKEFKMISVDVIDVMGEGVPLTDYALYYTKSKTPIELSQYGLLGKYNIANDGMLNDLDCDGTSITLSYSMDAENYKEKEFLIGRDCCHIINYTEGDMEIKIE